MPAFDPTGGLSQNGADQGKPNELKLSYIQTANNFGHRASCVAPLDQVNQTVYFHPRWKSSVIEYLSVTDQNLYGELYLPYGTMFRPINYAGFVVTGGHTSPNDAGSQAYWQTAPKVYYWDWRVGDWGELVGFDTMLTNTDTNLSYTRFGAVNLYNGRDGKLHALIAMLDDNTLSAESRVHATYEYSNDPLSGTWTVQNFIQEQSPGAFGYSSRTVWNEFTPNYDFSGTLYELASSNNNPTFHWWDFASDTVVDLPSVTTNDVPEISTTISASDSLKPNSSACLDQGSNNIVMRITNWKTGSQSTIDLPEFPLTKYNFIYLSDRDSYRRTYGIFDHINGYHVYILRNFIDEKWEVWKFDLFGQANMIAELPGVDYDLVADNYNYGQLSVAHGIGSTNSYVTLWGLPTGSSRESKFDYWWIDVSQ